MVDTSMYGRGGGIESGLRLGQAIGGALSAPMLGKIRSNALQRIQGGEDYNTVVNEVMQQSPEVAQELLNLRQQNQQAGLQDQSFQQGEQQIEIGGMKLSAAKIQQSAMPMFGAMMTDNLDARKRLLSEAAAPFQESNPEVYQEILDIAKQPPEVQVNAITGIIKAMRQAGVYPDDPSQMRGAPPAKVQEFEYWKQQNPNATPDQQQQMLDKILDPYSRALATGLGTGAARVGTEEQLNPVLAQRAGKQEEAKLTVQESVKLDQKLKADTEAFNVYDTAMRQLESSAMNASTGPGLGLIPAIAADDRIFEGAIKTMLPTLKALFRTAGEGTFTDKDQALLEGMIPTRNDSAEVRAAKIQMVDNMVRVKLGQSSQQQQTQQSQQPSGAIKVGRFTVESAGGQ